MLHNWVLQLRFTIMCIHYLINLLIKTTCKISVPSLLFLPPFSFPFISRSLALFKKKNQSKQQTLHIYWSLIKDVYPLRIVPNYTMIRALAHQADPTLQVTIYYTTSPSSRFNLTGNIILDNQPIKQIQPYR